MSAPDRIFVTATGFYFLMGDTLMHGPLYADGTIELNDFGEVDAAFLGDDCLEPEAAHECQKALAALGRKRFTVNGRAYTHLDMVVANPGDIGLCHWMHSAAVGDEYTDGETLRRVA